MSFERYRGSKRIKTVCVLVVLVFCESFFFRNILGNDLLISDRGDGRLTNLLAEHWWRFFQGEEKFSELLMFYPAQGVLGYSDMLLGHGLIYSVFRLAGFNMYVSYKFALIFMHGMGMVSMFYLLRKKLEISHIWSLFGTIAFCCSDTFARHIGHTQLMAVSMLPLLLIFLISFVQNSETRKKRNIFAYLFLAWFALLTYTAWYVAFFTGMFSLVFLITGAVRVKLALGGGSTHLSFIKSRLAAIGYDLAGYMVFLTILYIPFIYIYLPVFQTSSGYSYGDVSIYLPEIIDLINVTERNYMMGKFMGFLKLGDRGYSSEVEEGFSCILLLLFIVMFYIQKKRKQQRNKSGSKQQKKYLLTVENVFITVMVCIVLIIRLGSNGVSLWAVVYDLIPAARSIRGVARFLLWLSFPMAVITSYCADQYFNERKTISIILTGLIFLSNINKIGVSSVWSYGEELAFIDHISAPPEDAESFYIIDSKKTEDAAYIYQLDAFEIGTYYSLKTINGYSGQFPPGWDGIWDICSDTYESMVYKWMNMHGLTNVYAYDRAENVWISSKERMKYYWDKVFCPAENRFSISSGLEDINQGEFAWTAQNFKTKIKNTNIQKDGLKIKLSTALGDYMAQNPELEPYIRLYADGEYICDIPVNEGYAEYVIPMQEHISDEYEIELKTNCYFNPKDIGLNEDTRNLSIALYYIGN